MGIDKFTDLVIIGVSILVGGEKNEKIFSRSSWHSGCSMH